MSNDVAWIVELAVKDGQKDAANAMIDELVAATKADEPDVLNYEWHVSASGNEALIYERYKSAAAAQLHLDNFGARADRFSEIFDFTNVIILSDLPADMREALDGLSPKYRLPRNGFVNAHG